MNFRREPDNTACRCLNRTELPADVELIPPSIESKNLSAKAGMVTWATLIALLFLSIVAAVVFNTGRVINRKIEIQNAADAAAYSGSLWIARGMNALTASNHMIGELAALYVLHHSLGGRFLDEHSAGTQNSGPWSVKAADAVLFATFNINCVPPQPLATGPLDLSFWNPRPANRSHYNRVKKDPCADVNSTIFDAKLVLKVEMSVAYTAHRVGLNLYREGYLVQWVPGPIGAAGRLAMKIGKGMMLAAYATETAINAEYAVLDGVESLAQGLKGFKGQLPGAIQTIHTKYQELFVLTVIPGSALYDANGVADRHGASGFLIGDLTQFGPTSSKPDWFKKLLKKALTFGVQLPVEQPTTSSIARSQLMRATYPWMNYWRAPIRKFFTVLTPTSMASSFYGKWTDLYTEEAVRWLQLNGNYSSYKKYGMGRTGRDVQLYVIAGLNKTGQGFQKSMESWAKDNADPQDAENVFCHMGFAYQKQAPPIAASRFFRQENPDGMVALSQSMIYNANPQQKPKGSGPPGTSQPRVGWDTLNWIDNAPEYDPHGFWYYFFSFTYSVDAPEIKLNWQAKLTPATATKIAKTAGVVAGANLLGLPVRVGGPLKRSWPALYLNNH